MYSVTAKMVPGGGKYSSSPSPSPSSPEPDEPPPQAQQSEAATKSVSSYCPHEGGLLLYGTHPSERESSVAGVSRSWQEEASGGGCGVGCGVASGVASGVGCGEGSGVGSGVGCGVDSGVGCGVDSGVDSGVGCGEGCGVDSGKSGETFIGAVRMPSTVIPTTPALLRAACKALGLENMPAVSAPTLLATCEAGTVIVAMITTRS